MTPHFLPGVPANHILARLRQAPGNEIDSGKLHSPDSSAALAANALGWFIDRPDLLPPLPGTEAAGPAQSVEIEYCARFPWRGGSHPWLDAAVLTATHLIGIESKRLEPFRHAGVPSLSPAYDRPVWGPRMDRFGQVRDALRSGTLRPRHLDAAQLVKHAYGLVTEARRLSRTPVLAYLFAEPTALRDQPIPPADHARHRAEIADFAARVAGDEVLFAAASYRAWLAAASGPAAAHAAAVLDRFAP